MMIKVVGSFIIIGGSTLLGYLLSRDCSRRPQEIRVLQTLLQMFENEIFYLSNLLSDAFKKISRSSDSPVTVFFSETVKNLIEQDGITASQAWELAVRRNIRLTALNGEDEDILVTFGKMLGDSDVEGQLKNIRLTLNQLKLQEQKAEEARRKNEKMYRSLGVLGGLALVIILV